MVFINHAGGQQLLSGDITTQPHSKYSPEKENNTLNNNISLTNDEDGMDHPGAVNQLQQQSCGGVNMQMKEPHGGIFCKANYCLQQYYLQHYLQGVT